MLAAEYFYRKSRSKVAAIYQPTSANISTNFSANISTNFITNLLIFRKKNRVAFRVNAPKNETARTKEFYDPRINLRVSSIL